MIRIKRCFPADYRTLAEIWERSVRATHTFLSENDIAEIRKALIPDYFPNVDLYGITDHDGVIAGFIGLSGNRIEMLFVDDCRRGQGYGSRLMEYAIESGADSVDVNEQNPSALEFYLAKGFRIVGRDERDPAGRAFPILHLQLSRRRPIP